MPQFVDTVFAFEADPQASPRAARSLWQDAITNLTTADASPRTNPSVDISASANRPLFKRLGAKGTTVVLRLKYDAAFTTDPIVRVFGRSGEQAWECLRNQNSTPAVDATLADNATDDSSDGTFRYTNPTADHKFDCNNCDEIVVMLKQAAAGGGTPSTAVVQIKII